MTTFHPVTLDAQAAIARANQATVYQSGKCLQFVDVCFQKPPSDRQVLYGAPYTSAKEAADYTPADRRHGLDTARVGMVAFFSNGSAAGHVATINGIPTVRSSDKPSAGRVATVPIDEIIHSWGGRPFRFATDWLMGHNIGNLGAVLGGGGVSIPPATGTGGNPFGIPNVQGLQKIANLYGGGTVIDNQWGSRSASGFAQFLRKNYGYVGNDSLGPVMWAAIARWLRAKWRYVGNDVPGPVMRAALAHADSINLSQL